MTARRLCSAGRDDSERKGDWETLNSRVGSRQGYSTENVGFGSEIRDQHALLHFISLPGQLLYKDPLELVEGETFPWELKVRKLNARDKGSVEVKGIQHLPPHPHSWQVGHFIAQVCSAFGASGTA